MASAFFKRLTKKYGTENIKNKKYEAVIKEILAHNNMKTARAISRMSNDNYKNQVKKLSKKKQKVVKLPNTEEVLPKRSVFIIKAAEQGKMISDTLRTILEKTLRTTLKDFETTGQGKMEIQRGKTTGKINKKLIQEFQKNITGAFESYTKRDPQTGVPGNIRNIAVTEIRSTVGTIKAEYNRQFLVKNPGVKMMKTWLHNRRLSKKPRKTHVAMNRITIPVQEKFKVDREQEPGYDMMDRPHDPDAPAHQVIGCSCDVVYKAILGD